MFNHSSYFVARGLRRLALVLAFTMLGLIAACGGSGTNTTPTSMVKHRAFISNTFSGNLQIVDTQNDTTALTPETTNSAGQLVPGTPVNIPISNTVSFELETPNNTATAIYDPTTEAMFFVMNSTEMVAGDVGLSSAASSAIFSPDSTMMYVAEPNLPVAGSRNGGIQVLALSSISATAAYDVPAARYLAISPSGQYLLVFAGNSDSVFLINLTASTITPMEIPGFARPINAFFSADSNTAYVLNCGPECGSSSPASVTQLNIPMQTIMASLPVGGASVGLVSGSTLYVAGSPVPPGTTSTYDAVNLSNLTRITATSVSIGDGFHTTMALAPNNKLYIGASTCSNTVTGCLSVVDVSSNTADPPLPPRGVITSLLSVPNRNVMYAVEGGLMHVYNTTTDSLMGTQFNFQGLGALYSIVQVDTN